MIPRTSILTKSDLAVRDLDSIQKMEAGAVSAFIAFSEDEPHRIFEDRTGVPAERIAALGEFKEAGVKTGALIVERILNDHYPKRAAKIIRTPRFRRGCLLAGAC